MTTSRIVRGTRGRVVISVCLILIFTAILACFNQTRVELEKVQKTNDLCQQEQENLATQLQMISDYKLRLEKSLKTEKAEHQQAKIELESRVNEEKLRGEKTAGEATMRFNSLQQQYSILKTENGDLKEKCSKMQNDQLDEINNLQSKLKEIQEQLKQTEREKENSIEHLKSQMEQLTIEKNNFEKQIKSNGDKEEILRLQKELDRYRGNRRSSNLSSKLKGPEAINNENKTNFANLIQVDPNDYKVGNNFKISRVSASNVADIPTNVGDNQTFQAMNPENNQNVLPVPNNNNIGVKSSTPNSNMKASSKGSFNLVAPLRLPTVTPESVKNKTTSKKLPEGFVPPQVLQEPVHTEQTSKAADAAPDMVNNRYRNVAEDGQKSKLSDKINEIVERENGANEMLDFPVEEDENNDQLPKEGGFPKHHIDALGMGGDRDKANYDGDYDKLGNDANLEENEEDDDADEYGHPQGHKAIRN